MPLVSLTKDAVLASLKNVMKPELNKNLVSMNMIRDITVEASAVSFTILLTPPACPLKSTIEDQDRKTVVSLPGVKQVDMKMESSVPRDRRTRGLMQLPIRNAIAIAFGKGDVGRSTVAVNMPILVIVENMGYLELPDGTRMDIFGTGGGEKSAQQSGIAFLGMVPMDTSVRIGGGNGKPVIAKSPHSSAGVVDKIGQQIATGVSVAAVKKINPEPITIVE